MSDITEEQARPCKWYTREFSSEDEAHNFAETLVDSPIYAVNEGPFVTGPFPGETGDEWLVEYCEWEQPTN